MTEEPGDPVGDGGRVPPGLDHVAVVLCEPQDPINVGTTVRAMKNMGLGDLRLVRPRHYDPRGVIISAPNAEDFIDAIAVHEDLDAALASTVRTYALTARGRRARQQLMRPREAAEDILERAGQGTVALLFGREDRGLTNEQVDRADVVVTIPTVPDYSSLNLGQAVLVMAYELFVLGGEAAPLREPRRDFPLATHADLEGLFGQIESSMTAVEFLKPATSEGVMRSVRGVIQRAELDEREARIFRGMFHRMVKFIKRKGWDEGG